MRRYPPQRVAREAKPPAVDSPNMNLAGIIIAQIALTSTLHLVKRLTWLLLAVFCTALVQVQPLERLTKAETCGCCHTPGACGMPGCCPTPASTLFAASAERSSSMASSAARKARRSRGATSYFYASFVGMRPIRSLLQASAEAAPAAQVPFFKAHCSYLI
jgi:hypothetical protein